MAVTRSRFIEQLSLRTDELSVKEIEQGVRLLIELMSDRLTAGSRVEIRGFGSLDLIFRQARVCRNPKTGNKVSVACKYTLHFKAGKELRDLVNQAMQREAAASDNGLPLEAGSGG